MPVVGEIPYDSDVTAAMMAGKTIVQHSGGKPSKAISLLWEEVKARLELGSV